MSDWSLPALSFRIKPESVETTAFPGFFLFRWKRSLFQVHLVYYLQNSFPIQLIPYARMNLNLWRKESCHVIIIIITLRSFPSSPLTRMLDSNHIKYLTPVGG